MLCSLQSSVWIKLLSSTSKQINIWIKVWRVEMFSYLPASPIKFNHTLLSMVSSFSPQISCVTPVVFLVTNEEEVVLKILVQHISLFKKQHFVLIFDSLCAQNWFARPLDLYAEAASTAEEHRDYTGIRWCNLTCCSAVLSQKRARAAYLFFIVCH